jgi:hypothetical protein
MMRLWRRTVPPADLPLPWGKDPLMVKPRTEHSGDPATRSCLGSSVWPPCLAAARGVRLIQPYASRQASPDLKRLAAGAPGPLSLPRNTPVWLPLLAQTLQREQPDFLLHVSPAESRDTLALYEAWWSRSPSTCRILGVSVHPHLPPDERRRQLYGAVAELVPEPARLDHSGFAEQVRGWQRLERAILHVPRTGVWDWYTAIRQAVDVYAPLPRLPAAADPDTTSESPCGRLALFGDWLLGPELVRFIGDANWQVCFVQPLFDLADWPGDLHPDDAWSDHPAFRPIFDKLARYRSLLEERAITAAIIVTASFSPQLTVLRRFAVELPCPAVILESEIPGALSEQNRIRLENFLRGIRPQRAARRR